MARYFIKLSYCGDRYNGWQSQPHEGTVTVQFTIEKTMALLLREEISITGCGRTDTGVHAIGYIAHFDILAGFDTESAIYKLNKMLPGDIVIHDIFQVEDGAHARFDASSRSYKYHLHIHKNPFPGQSFYYRYDVPDISKLNEAASLLMEYDDFSTFCKVNSDVLTMQCRITESRWESDGDNFIYYVTADRFLRGMIRLIVGMCLNVSRGKLSIDELKKAMNENTRTGQDWSVPPNGLILYNIKYPYLDQSQGD